MASRISELAAQRASLRRAAGPEQGRNGRQARRGADQDLAAQLRHPAAAADSGGPAIPGQGSAVCRSLRGRIAADRMSQRHGGWVLPYWHETIAPAIRQGQRVLIAAHGNSLRALVKYLDNISDDAIVELNIPTGIPLVYDLDADLRPIRSEYLGDPEAAKRAAEKVAAQAKGSRNSRLTPNFQLPTPNSQLTTPNYQFPTSKKRNAWSLGVGSWRLGVDKKGLRETPTALLLQARSLQPEVCSLTSYRPPSSRPPRYGASAGTGGRSQ